MGCMVSNGILTIPDTPVFSRIVFMAPAAQIEGALGGLNSYMARHKETRCHILTLHEKAEVAEKMYAGLPPRGSLLVWIDDFLVRPLTPLQHTSGRFTNALTMSYLFLPEVEDRVSLKAFSVGWNAPEGNPQTHGEFAKLPFWNEEFWQPRRTPEP